MPSPAGELRSVISAWPALLLAALIATPVTATAALPDNGQNFSSLRGITPANAKDLKRAWVYETGDLKHRRLDQLVNMSFQSTPRLIDGAIVFCTPFSEVIALDPLTGRQRWRFDPHIDDKRLQKYQYKCRGPVPFWRDAQLPQGAPCATRLFIQTLDDDLFALDSRTGQRCGKFGRNGMIHLLAPGEAHYPDEMRFITTPIVVAERIIIGSAMTDNFHVENPSGKVRAFDVRTGAPAWSFDPIPRHTNDPNMSTWDPRTAPANGGANVWSLIAADPSRGLVFLPTTSPTVDHFGGQRPGANLYADSLVALDAKSGRMRWYQQIVHHDLWDYDLPAQPIVADLTIGGKSVPAVIQNTKMGLVFVFNRETGKPIFPIEERRVPQGGVAGESVYPTQRFPVGMPPLGPLGMSESDVWGAAGVDEMICRRRFRTLRSEGIYTPPSLKGTIVRPSIFGGTNWGGASLDVRSGVMIAPVITVAAIIKLTGRDKPAPPPPPGHFTFQDGPITFPAEGSPYRPSLELFQSIFGAPCTKPPWYTLVALDIPHRKILWRAPLGTAEGHLPLGSAFAWGAPAIGGIVSTEGGVTFTGGTLDRRVRAFRSSDGRELWSDRLPTTVHSPPLVYHSGAYDYVLFAAGGHSILHTRPGDTLVAYRTRSAADEPPLVP